MDGSDEIAWFRLWENRRTAQAGLGLHDIDQIAWLKQDRTMKFFEFETVIAGIVPAYTEPILFFVVLHFFPVLSRLIPIEIVPKTAEVLFDVFIWI